ncbi:MAG: hypothetical protein WCR06_09190 [bacterium]
MQTLPTILLLLLLAVGLAPASPTTPQPLHPADTLQPGTPTNRLRKTTWGDAPTGLLKKQKVPGWLKQYEGN